MSADKVVVVGGGGFVGKSLCFELLRSGHTVVSVGRGEYPELTNACIEVVRLDIANPDISALTKAFEGAVGVFHTAADVSMWGPYSKFYRTNVLGTRNIIQACKTAGVRILVYTSSPSVIACGRDLRDVDETIEYPLRYNAFYPLTKAIAEREILAANCDSLFTVALRPHLIFGRGDNHFEPLIVKRAKQGRLVKIGQGENLVSLCHIEDCTSAHLSAYEACLRDEDARGRVFFVKSGDVNLWRWIDCVLEKNGLSKVKRSVPVGVALILGGMFDFFAKISGYRLEPPFTKFLVEEMVTDHFFNIEGAKRYLGWEPKHTNLFEW